MPPEDLLAPPMDPTATTGAAFAQALLQMYPDPLNVAPYEALALLEGLATETKDVTERWEIAVGSHGMDGVAQGFIHGIAGPVSLVDASAIPSINDTLALWKNRLKYYMQQTTKALGDGVGEVDLAGRSEFYKQVTGPLIAGECFGEPSCSNGLVAQIAPNTVQQIPTAASIFIIETMMGEAKNVALNRSYGMLDAVSDTAAEYAKWGKEALEGIGEAIGETIGAGIEAAGKRAGEEGTKLLWTMAGIAGLGALIWFGGKAAIAGAAKKKATK